MSRQNNSCTENQQRLFYGKGKEFDLPCVIFHEMQTKTFFLHFVVAGPLKRNSCFFLDHWEALRKTKWLFFPPSLGSFTNQRFMRKGKEEIDLKHSKVNWKIYSHTSMNTYARTLWFFSTPLRYKFLFGNCWNSVCVDSHSRYQKVFSEVINNTLPLFANELFPSITKIWPKY